MSRRQTPPGLYIRLAVALRSDLDVMMLSDGAFRTFIELMLWAREQRSGGVVPGDDRRVAVLRRIDPASAAEHLAELSAAGLVEPAADGDDVRFRSWDRWQAPLRGDAAHEQYASDGRRGALVRWHREGKHAEAVDGCPECDGERAGGAEVLHPADDVEVEAVEEGEASPVRAGGASAPAGGKRELSQKVLGVLEQAVEADPAEAARLYEQTLVDTIPQLEAARDEKLPGLTQDVLSHAFEFFRGEQLNPKERARLVSSVRTLGEHWPIFVLIAIVRTSASSITGSQAAYLAKVSREVQKQQLQDAAEVAA